MVLYMMYCSQHDIEGIQVDMVGLITRRLHGQTRYCWSMVLRQGVGEACSLGDRQRKG